MMTKMLGLPRILKRGREAFTITELIVAVLVFWALVFLLWPAGPRAARKSKRIMCTNNLKNLGLAFRVFETDHPGQSLTSTSTNESKVWDSKVWDAVLRSAYQRMSNELATPALLVCPADTRVAATNFAQFSSKNLSYFMGVEVDPAYPSLLLAGDRNLTTNGVTVPPGMLVVTSNMVVGFTKAMHGSCGNVVLGDGSVQQLGGTAARPAVTATSTNRLAIP